MVPVSTRPPSVGYREAPQADYPAWQAQEAIGRHGQFGDVMLESSRCRVIRFKFEDRITGGVVPRNYIPAVEEGVTRSNTDRSAFP